MDLHIVFELVLLIFTLAALGAVVYVPYKMFQFFVRGIAKATFKTYHAIIPTKK